MERQQACGTGHNTSLRSRSPGILKRRTATLFCKFWNTCPRHSTPLLKTPKVLECILCTTPAQQRSSAGVCHSSGNGICCISFELGRQSYSEHRYPSATCRRHACTSTKSLRYRIRLLVLLISNGSHSKCCHAATTERVRGCFNARSPGGTAACCNRH